MFFEDVNAAIQDTQLRFPIQPRADATNGFAIQVGDERLFHTGIYVRSYMVEGDLRILYESAPRTDEDLPDLLELIPSDRLD